MMFLFSICAVFITTYTEAQLFPEQYVVRASTTPSVNGSSINGHCSSGTFSSGTITCTDPTSSVLFDGHIPTLTGLDGDMWASQLLTLESDIRLMEISFDFTNRGCDDVERLELVFFNCPEWGIGAQIIRLFESSSSSSIDRMDTNSANPSGSSCDSLTRVSLLHMTPRPVLTVQITPPPGARFVHIAEVEVFNRGTSCPDTTALEDMTTTDMTTSITETTMITESETEPTTPVTEMEICTSCFMPVVLASVITAITTALLATVIFVLVLIAVCGCCLRSKRTTGGNNKAETVEGQAYSPTHKETLDEYIPMKEGVAVRKEKAGQDTQGYDKVREGTARVNTEETDRHACVDDSRDNPEKERHSPDQINEGVVQVPGGMQKDEYKMDGNTGSQNLPQNAGDRHSYAVVGDGAPQVGGGEKDGYVRMDGNKGISVVNLPEKAGPDAHGYDRVRTEHVEDGYVKMDGNKGVSVVSLNGSGTCGYSEGAVATQATTGEKDGYVQMDGNKGVSVVSLHQSVGQDAQGYDRVRDGVSQVTAGEKDGYVQMDGNKGVSVVSLHQSARQDAQGYDRVRDGVSQVTAGEKDGYVRMDGNKGISVVNLHQKAEPTTHGYDKVRDDVAQVAVTEKDGYVKMDGNKGASVVDLESSRRESSVYTEIDRSSTHKTDQADGYDRVGGRVAALKDPNRRQSSGYAEVKRRETTSETDQPKQGHDYDQIHGHLETSSDRGRPTHVPLAVAGVAGQGEEKHSYEKIPGHEKEAVSPAYMEVGQKGNLFAYKSSNPTQQ